MFCPKNTTAADKEDTKNQCEVWLDTNNILRDLEK